MSDFLGVLFALGGVCIGWAISEILKEMRSESVGFLRASQNIIDMFTGKEI